MTKENMKKPNGVAFYTFYTFVENEIGLSTSPAYYALSLSPFCISLHWTDLRWTYRSTAIASGLAACSLITPPITSNISEPLLLNASNKDDPDTALKTTANVPEIADSTGFIPK